MEFIYYIYFAAIVIALGYTVYRMCKDDRKTEAFIVFVISCIIMCHFGDTWYKMIFRPDFEFHGVMLHLTNLCTSILIPIIYTYICRQFHLHMFSATAYCIYGIAAICLFDSMYISIDSMAPTMALGNPHIHIFLNGKELWYWNIYEVPLFFQSLMVTLKMLKLRNKMHREKLNVSHKGLQFLSTLVFAMFLALIIALIPDNGWNSMTTAIYMGTYTVLGVVLLIMISKRYDVYAIVNEENEPEYLEVTPKFDPMNESFKKLVEEEKIYLNPQLSLVDVAQMLGTNRTYVSRMVNETYGESFSAFINRYRLEYAKTYMAENPRAKIDTIASECGFGSTSSFNKLFKSVMGTTPSAWIKGDNSAHYTSETEETENTDNNED